MKIEKYKHTGEIITGNVYIPRSYYNEVEGDKKKIKNYIMGGNSIVCCSVDGRSGFEFEIIGNDNHLGEVYWVNDENTYLKVLEFPQKG